MEWCSPLWRPTRRPSEGVEHKVATGFGYSLGAVGSARDLETAARAVGDLDLVLPGQPVLAGNQIAHVGVRAILRAAFDRDKAAVTELVDIVLHAPEPPGFVGEFRPHLSSDDLIRCTSAGHERNSVKIDDHAFAHGIEHPVGSGHADIGRVHQIGERVALIADVPGVPDRRRVAGGAQHDVGALVGAFSRHLRKHAVVADDQRDLAAVRPVAHRNTQVAWLPRLNWYPRMHLSVIELHLSPVIDDDTAVVRIAVGVVLHDGKTAPDVVLGTGLLEARNFRSIKPRHELGVGVHRKAVQRIFGEDDKVHGRHAFARLLYHRANLCRLSGKVAFAGDRW